MAAQECEQESAQTWYSSPAGQCTPDIGLMMIIQYDEDFYDDYHDVDKWDTSIDSFCVDKMMMTMTMIMMMM